jgi:hypothetical protein
MIRAGNPLVDLHVNRSMRKSDLTHFRCSCPRDCPRIPTAARELSGVRSRRAPVYLTLDHFQPIDMAVDRPVAPPTCDGLLHRGQKIEFGRNGRGHPMPRAVSPSAVAAWRERRASRHKEQRRHTPGGIVRPARRLRFRVRGAAGNTLALDLRHRPPVRVRVRSAPWRS